MAYNLGEIFMRKCQNCGYKWKAKEIWTLGFSKSGKKCPNCGEKQYISVETQGIFTLGYISLICVIIFPFLIKLSSKDKTIL